MKKIALLFLMSFIVSPLLNAKEYSEDFELDSKIEIKRNCDAEAEEAYFKVKALYGGQLATQVYLGIHADCTQSGGGSEYGVNL